MVTAGRTAFFSGITVAAALAALAILPQRFLYSMAVAGASVGLLSAIVAVLVVPSMLAPAGNADRRPLDPPRGRRSRPSPTAGTASPAA